MDGWEVVVETTKTRSSLTRRNGSIDGEIMGMNGIYLLK